MGNGGRTNGRGQKTEDEGQIAVSRQVEERKPRVKTTGNYSFSSLKGILTAV